METRRAHVDSRAPSEPALLATLQRGSIGSSSADTGSTTCSRQGQWGPNCLPNIQLRLCRLEALSFRAVCQPPGPAAARAYAPTHSVKDLLPSFGPWRAVDVQEPFRGMTGCELVFSKPFTLPLFIPSLKRNRPHSWNDKSWRRAGR